MSLLLLPFLLLIFYFVFHLVNLASLPIFNDEAIYLDWAWTSFHLPGRLFVSLTDAKQPLVIWIFALFEKFMADPLKSGRLVAVIAGAITSFGLYRIATKLFSRKVAILAMFLYSIIPIFVFYNRQALFEAVVAAAGVWCFNFTWDLLDKPNQTNSLLLGITYSLGFLMKFSALIFVIASITTIMIYSFKEKTLNSVKFLALSLGTFLVGSLVVFSQPLFWQTLPTNTRYIFSPSELALFPFNIWLTNLLGFIEIIFVFMTPVGLFLSLIGSILIIGKSVNKLSSLLTFFLTAALIEIVTVRSQSQRYAVAFLPLLVIPWAYFLSRLWTKAKLSAVILPLVPLVVSLFVVFNPDQYLRSSKKISTYADVAHISGQTSGYGIKETMEYLKSRSLPNQPTLVLFALNAGNPENAIDLYSNQDRRIFPLHIDSKLFTGLENIDCLTSDYPTFFITRATELSGMDHYFNLEKSFPNPEGDYFIGIYQLKKDCEGTTASLSSVYKSAIRGINEIREGN